MEYERETFTCTPTWETKQSMRDAVLKLHVILLSDLEHEYLFKNDETESISYQKWKSAIRFYDDSPIRRYATFKEDFDYLKEEGIFSIGNYGDLIEILAEVDHIARAFVLEIADDIRRIQKDTNSFKEGPPKVQLSGKKRIEEGNDISIKGFILSNPSATDVQWKCMVDGTAVDININTKRCEGSIRDMYNPVLVIKNAVLKDSGNYFLSVRNRCKLVISEVYTVKVIKSETTIEVSTIISVTPRNDDKKYNTNKFLSMTCRTINTVADWISQTTTIETVLALVDNVDLCSQNIYQESDRVLIESLLDSVTQKILWWGEVDREKRFNPVLNIIRQLTLIAKRFNTTNVKVEKGSLLFQMKFESRKDFECYEMEFKNGELEKRFLSFLTYEPYLNLFDLEKDDVILKIEDLQQMSKKEKSESTCVAAIDFGPYTSGYAYARKKKWNEIDVSLWAKGKVTKSQTNNHILLNPDQTFHSFGFEAQDAYAKMAGNGSSKFKDHFYFEDFASELPEQGSLDISVKDRGEKTLPIVFVLKVAFGYIIDHMLDRIKQESPNMEMDEITCVLVTPLHCNEAFTSVVQHVFEEKGFDAAAVSIISHYEGIARYCQFSTEDELEQLKPGTSYMVINLGEQVSTVSLHVQGNGTEYEVQKVADIPLGFRHIRDNFLKFLSNLLGKSMLDKIMRYQQEDYRDLLQEFEIQMMKFRLSEDNIQDDIECSISPMIPAYIQTESGATIFDIIEASEYEESVNFSSGNLVLSQKLFRSFLEPVIESIAEGVKPFNSKHDPSTIIFCGELSKCSMIQKRFRDVFELKEVLFLSDPDVVELKGAVLGSVRSKEITKK